MKVQKSAVAIAVGAAAALIGVGAQAANNTTAVADPAPATTSPMATPIDGGVAWFADETAPDLTITTYSPSGDVQSKVQPTEEPTSMQDSMRSQIEKTRAFASTLVGMNINDAQALTSGTGFSLRIVQQDGEYFMVTMDYRTNRIDLVINNDIITEVSVG